MESLNEIKTELDRFIDELQDRIADELDSENFRDRAKLINPERLDDKGRYIYLFDIYNTINKFVVFSYAVVFVPGEETIGIKTKYGKQNTAELVDIVTVSSDDFRNNSLESLNSHEHILDSIEEDFLAKLQSVSADFNKLSR